MSWVTFTFVLLVSVQAGDAVAEVSRDDGMVPLPMSTIASKLVAAQQDDDTCDRATGSCRFFSCSASHGPTDCVHGRCMCKEGSCPVDRACKDINPDTSNQYQCDRATPGSCRFFGCRAGRGPTDCVEHKCVCKEGFCSVGGMCTRVMSKGAPCEKDWDYQDTKCDDFCCTLPNGKNICKATDPAQNDGYAFGLCYTQPATAFANTSVLQASGNPAVSGRVPSARRRAANTVRSLVETVRQPAPNVASADVFTCTKATPGTCRLFGCKATRGQTDCVAHQCVCKPGFCSVGGVCDARTVDGLLCRKQWTVGSSTCTDYCCNVPDMGTDGKVCQVMNPAQNGGSAFALCAGAAATTLATAPQDGFVLVVAALVGVAAGALVAGVVLRRRIRSPEIAQGLLA